MFQHTLIATDGSLLSEGVVDKVMDLAREAGAKVTVVTDRAFPHLCDIFEAALRDKGQRSLAINERRELALNYGSAPLQSRCP